MSTAAPTKVPTTAPAAAGRRVVVLCERGAAGNAALDLARQLDLQEHATVTVVAVAPRARSGSRCGGSAIEFNAAVRDAVAEELEDARGRLGHASGRASYALLTEGEDLPLEEWIAAERFDLILLPARRRPFRSPGHPAAARLRRILDAEVRVVTQSAPSRIQQPPA